MSKELREELFGWLRFLGMILLVVIGFSGTAWSGAHIKSWTFLNITTPASIPLVTFFWVPFIILALMAVSVRQRLDKNYPALGIPCLAVSLILTGLIFFATTTLPNTLMIVLAILAGSTMGLGVVTFAYRDNIMKISSG